MMRIDVLTLFPEMFESPLNYSILKRAQQAGVVDIVLTNIRDFATDKYKKVDDKPYGGGQGMVMMPGPIFDCFEYVKGLSAEDGRIILLTPQGQKFPPAFILSSLTFPDDWYKICFYLNYLIKKRYKAYERIIIGDLLFDVGTVSPLRHTSLFSSLSLFSKPESPAKTT